MSKRFNKNDVLRYLYDEMEPAEQEDFLKVLYGDEELWREYELLQGSIDLLEKAELEPSENSVQRILYHARMALIGPPPRRTEPVNKLLLVHQVVSVFMVLFTTVTIGMVMYMYSNKPQQSFYSSENIRLQWEDSYLDQKMELVKLNMESVSGEKEALIHLYHNTYRLINTEQFSPFTKNVVLLNIR